MEALALVAIVVLAVAVKALGQVSRSRRRPNRRSRPGPARPSAAPSGESPFPPDGVRLVVTPLLNASERAVKAQVEAWLSRWAPDHRLHAQVSLDEIIAARGGAYGARMAARARYAQKRVDLLVVDRDETPVLGIEYHGRGHHRGNAAERDAIKARAFAAAGLRLAVIEEGWTDEDLRAVLRPLASVTPVVTESRAEADDAAPPRAGRALRADPGDRLTSL